MLLISSNSKNGRESAITQLNRVCQVHLDRPGAYGESIHFQKQISIVMLVGWIKRKLKPLCVNYKERNSLCQNSRNSLLPLYVFYIVRSRAIHAPLIFYICS